MRTCMAGLQMHLMSEKSGDPAAFVQNDGMNGGGWFVEVLQMSSNPQKSIFAQ